MYEKIKIGKNPERRHLKNCLRKVHTKFREAAMIGKTQKSENTVTVGRIRVLAF